MNSQSALQFEKLNRTLAFLFGLICILSGYGALAQTNPSKQELVNGVLAHIYDYEFGSASRMLDSLESTEPDATEWNLLRANIAWWQILAGKVEDPNLEQEFLANLDSVSEQLDRNDLTLEQTYQVILVRAFKSRYGLLDKNYLAAVRQLNACIDQISETFGSESKFEPLYLTSGLYYYFMKMAHDDYLFLRPYLMFFPDGDKAKGLRFLERMSKTNDVFLRNEGHYFLLRIYFDVEKDYEEARIHASALLKHHPENLIYRLYSFKTELAIGDQRAAAKERKEYLNSIKFNSELDQSEREFYISLLEGE